MKNILSIDFDIVLGESLNPKERMISNHRYPWAEGEKYRVDYEIYAVLTKLILSLKNIESYSIKDHHEILDLLPKEKINLINIDHHHDIIYGKERPNIDCGNWVWFLNKTGFLISYTWVRDEFSLPPKRKISCYNDILFSDFRLEKRVDMVIICLSPQWIPKEVTPLFKVWEEILGLKK